MDMFNKIKDKLKNNKALMISLVAGLIVLIGAVSYAAYDYSFTGKDSSISTGTVSIKFLESNTNVIDLKNALPISDSEGKKGDSFDFAVTTKANYNIGMKYTLNLKKLSVDSGYTSLSDNRVKIYLTDYNDSSLLDPTLISGLDNNKIYSKTNKHSSTNTKITDKYKLRVWVDSNVDASDWNQDTKLEYKFKIDVNGEQTEISLDNSGANKPILDSGMIPVYYDDISETWKKADEKNQNEDYQWYDYSNKMWANSVTVSSTNRSKYLSASAGTEIPMDDILTMQVWIPRYKYKVWNYNADGTKKSSEQEIEIAFENGTDKTGEITCEDAISGTDGDPSETCKLKETNEVCADDTCNNKTYTHPAFTFGDKEIKGFWIGKFELTGTIDSITTKPNLGSLNNQSVSSYETNIMKMNDSGNKYGIPTSMDTHMIKNSEWGAVAYLSNSKYGICTSGTCKKVNINNSSKLYTGRSGGDPSASSTLEGTYKYNDIYNKTTVMTGGTAITPTVTNDTTYPWTSSDGLYKSSNQGKSPTTTNLKFSFTVSTDNTYLSFDWSISCGIMDGFYYTITKDGTTLSGTGTSTKIGGTTLGKTEDSLIYKNVQKKLDKGTYELTFTYVKDFGADGTDTGYVKNIKIIDSPIFKEVRSPIGNGKDGPSASTTHNVYGVYDMSGGLSEYTMANMVSSDETTMMSGFDSSLNSGYTGKIYDSGNYTLYTGIEYPNDKYYDKYSFSTNNETIIRSKLGDGLKEVYNGLYNWYSGFSVIVNSMHSWFIRGGPYSAGVYSGMFDLGHGTGGFSSDYSSRLIITP